MTNTPVAPIDQGQVESIVAAAVLAPSVLNCQPWRFHAHGDVIDVWVDRDCVPSAIDLPGREVMMSVGAALMNLRLAAVAAGRSPQVQLMPEPDQPTFAARVRFGGPIRMGADERELFEAIPDRRSSRVPFDGRLVPFENYFHLQEAAEAEGTYLDLITGNQRDVVVDVLHDADRLQRSDPAAVAEVRRWTVDRPSSAGIPDTSMGPRAADPSSVVRDMALGNRIADRPSAEFETSALLAVLLTTGDSPIDWLRAGLGLERVLLRATADGISVGLLSQACEMVELRPLMRDPMSRWHHPQIVMRFGYAEPMPPTPRRPVADVLSLAQT